MNAKYIAARRRTAAALTLVAVLVALVGCARGTSAVLGARVSRITSVPVAPTFGADLYTAGPDATLRLAYADMRARTVVVAELPTEGDPASATHIVMDRIAEGGGTVDDFGSLAYAVIGGVEYLAYQDRSADGSLSLKQLSRPAGDEVWEIDLVEPPGRPLGFLSTADDVRLLVQIEGGVWAAGISPRVRGDRRELVADVRPRGRVSVVRRAEGDAAVLFDEATGRMVLVGWSGTRSWSLELKPRGGGSFGPVYDARLDPDGKVCLFYFDAKTQELLDLQDVEGGSHLVRVTRARDVSTVQARSDVSGTTYVYADLSLEAGARLVPTLSVIHTSQEGAVGMRRVGTSLTPYRSILAFPTPGDLLILALTDELYVYRLPMAGS